MVYVTYAPAVALALLASVGIPAAHAQDLPPLSQEPSVQRGPANMESTLADLYRAGLEGGDASSQADGVRLSSGPDGQMVQVVLEMASADTPPPQGLGIVVETTYDNLIQARVPVPSLGAIASDEGVKFVRLPFMPVLASDPPTPASPLAGTDDGAAVAAEGDANPGTAGDPNLAYFLVVPIAALAAAVALLAARRRSAARARTV